MHSDKEMNTPCFRRTQISSGFKQTDA